MDRIYQGQDWGYYPDPLAFLRLYYNRAQEKIYLIDELVENRWSNRRAADWIIDKGYNDYEVFESICTNVLGEEVQHLPSFSYASKPYRRR